MKLFAASVEMIVSVVRRKDNSRSLRDDNKSTDNKSTGNKVQATKKGNNGAGLAVKGVPDQDEGECGDNDCRGPGDDVEPAGVGVFAHQLVPVDELQHEDQDQG